MDGITYNEKISCISFVAELVHMALLSCEVQIKRGICEYKKGSAYSVLCPQSWIRISYVAQPEWFVAFRATHNMCSWTSWPVERRRWRVRHRPIIPTACTIMWSDLLHRAGKTRADYPDILWTGNFGTACTIIWPSTQGGKYRTRITSIFYILFLKRKESTKKADLQWNW